MTTTPPGWYDDGHGALRWWDGVQWTEHVAQPDPEASAAPTEAEIVAAQAGYQPAAPVGAVENVEPATAGTGEAATTAIDPGVAAYLAQQNPAAAEPPQPVAEPAGAAPYGAAPQYGTAPQYSSAPPYGSAPQYGTAPQNPVDPAAAPYAQQYPAYTPASYPGGAFVAATEPRTSKLWIVWVVLGVVLLGIVIAVAVLVPLLILNASSGQGVQSDDKEAAADTVRLYDDAWQNADCDAYFASTSADFRDALDMEDCTTFQEGARLFAENTDDYTITIEQIDAHGDEIAVTTTETYTTTVDENGDPIDPEDRTEGWRYTLIQEDGAWVIDDAS